jgi:hypothetical protein
MGKLIAGIAPKLKAQKAQQREGSEAVTGIKPGVLPGEAPERRPAPQRGGPARKLGGISTPLSS